MRIAWVLAVAACAACGGANHEYATAAGFAGAAALVEAAELARGEPAARPPCGEDVLVCRGASERVCATDKNGCEVCSCQTPAGTVEPFANPDSWH